MLAVVKKFDKVLCRALEIILIIAVIVLTVDVLWGVATRYILGSQAKWTEELARFLLVWVSLLGGAVAFGEKAHLGVDYFVNLMDPSGKRIMALLSCVAIAFFVVTVFLVGGWQLVQDNLASGQKSPALQINMGLVYAAVPISGVFILFFTFEQMLEALSKQAVATKEAK